jgi:glyoxalase/bleomycin resistance protein/dioxygenase superfamily protein
VRLARQDQSRPGSGAQGRRSVDGPQEGEPSVPEAARPAYDAIVALTDPFRREHLTMRLSYPEACGLRHLAFEVPGTEQAVAALERRGVAVERVRVDECTGKRFTLLAGPAGLPPELYER